MKKSGLLFRYQVHFIFIFLIFLALFLRTYKLGDAPAGLSWDEAAIGYNGFAIATQHRDEWLQKTPIEFKSFGEYKPPIAIYAAAVTTTLFGVNAFAIRLPMALSGVTTTVAVFFIALKLFQRKSIALFAMALVVVSPLNIQFSRIAFESSLGVAAVTVGMALYLYARESRKYQWLLYFLAFIAWGVSLYTNHTTKIVLPFIILAAVWQDKKELKKKLPLLTIGFFILLFASYPIIKQILSGSGTERLVMTSAFVDANGHKSLLESISIFIHNFFAHFDPRFLVLGEADNYRNGNMLYGILSWVEFFLFFVGLFFTVTVSTVRKKYWWLIALVAVGIIPAAISNVIPHANRVHHIIPWVQLVCVVGMVELEKQFSQTQKKWLFPVVCSAMVAQLIWQLPIYYRVYTGPAAEDFQYGYQAAIAEVSKYQDQVDEIYFTDKYEQPYIYFLLYKKIKPTTYQYGALNRYRMGKIVWTSVAAKQHILIVAAPGDVPAEIQPTETIAYPDGKTAFQIYLR